MPIRSNGAVCTMYGTQSVPDKIRTEKTGVYAQGDAAFADYSLNMGVAFKFYSGQVNYLITNYILNPTYYFFNLKIFILSLLIATNNKRSFEAVLIIFISFTSPSIINPLWRGDIALNVPLPSPFNSSP